MKVIIDGVEYEPVKKGVIKVGDTVKVKYPGMNYSGYYTWPEWRKAPIEYAIRYQYKGEGPNTKDVYTVRYMGKHEYGNTTLAVIERKLCLDCYLINVNGLVKVDSGYMP